MHRYFYLLPFLIFSIWSAGFNPSDSDNKNCSLIVSPTATPTPAVTNESEEIVLDKKLVCLPCLPGRRSIGDSGCADQNTMITVSSVKPGNNMVKYEYTISGGRIIGEGAKVIWDMTDTQPGTYQIRIDIEDRFTGQKRAETKIITVQDPNCFMDCDCPTLSVNASTTPIKAGETISFTANVGGGSQAEVTYNWTISEGEIIEGQGTPNIKVATNPKMAGKIVKATVEVGEICEECQKTESASVSIANVKRNKK